MDQRGETVSSDSEDGGSTQDLSQRFTATAPVVPPPNAGEQKIQTRGAWMTVTGVTITVLTVLVAVVWHFGFNGEMPAAFTIPLYLCSFGLIYLGSTEYLGRRARATQEATLDRLARVERAQQLLVHLLPEAQKDQWYTAYCEGAREVFAATGTDYTLKSRRDADVLSMRRNRPPR